MSRVTTSEARALFSDIVNRAAFGKERVVLTRRGKAVAAVVPFEDLEELERIEEAEDIRAVREAWAEQGDEEPVTLDELKARLGFGKKAIRRPARRPAR